MEELIEYIKDFTRLRVKPVQKKNKKNETRMDKSENKRTVINANGNLETWCRRE